MIFIAVQFLTSCVQIEQPREQGSTRSVWDLIKQISRNPEFYEF